MCEDMGSHLVSHVYCFDGNPEYHEDGLGDARGMRILKDFTREIADNIYIVLTAQKLSFSLSGLPSDAYDVFWQFGKLRNLHHIESAVDIGNDINIPIAVIDLKGFDYEAGDSQYFNPMRSMFVISDQNIEFIESKMSTWVSSNSLSKSTSFFQTLMTSTLRLNDNIAFYSYTKSSSKAW